METTTLMQNFPIKIKTFLFFLLIQGTVYSQNKNSEDTTSKIALCQSTLSYPKKAQENNISGTVIVLFDIDSNCRIVNVRIEKGIGYGCDEEAMNVLKKCRPKFINGRKKCKETLNLHQPFTFAKPEDD